MGARRFHSSTKELGDWLVVGILGDEDRHTRGKIPEDEMLRKESSRIYSRIPVTKYCRGMIKADSNDKESG